MPSADSRRRPLTGLAAALAATALAVTGCAAGQDAQTAEQTSVVDGSAFGTGSVVLRDMGVRPPTGPSFAEGDNAYLEGLILNQAAAGDELLSVSTPAASSVEFYSNGVSALLGLASSSASASPSDTATPTGSTSPTDTTTATATPGDTTSDTASATSSSSSSTSTGAATSPLSTVSLPTQQAVLVGYQNDQIAIVLVGLTAALFPAQSIPITFTFANAGSVTADIAVKLPTDRTLDAPTIDTAEGGE